MAFLYSTIDGGNLVARGLDLQAGDNVVIDELHFITSLYSFANSRRKKEWSYAFVVTLPEKETHIQTSMVMFNNQIDINRILKVLERIA